jgi:hypothetical protein
MAAAMPVEIQRGRIARVKRPALSPREQGQFDNAVRT